ncbi:MAG: DUF2905 domain-containing protein [Bacteriovoracaceae bacterium]|nr:DUF2905 domain-containing protein [Bacteriovoracaceae bacterium]
MNLLPLTKIFLGLSCFFAVLAVIWQLSGGNIPLGRLPGDIRIESDSGGFYFPITTCLLLSALLSGISYLIKHWK